MDEKEFTGEGMDPDQRFWLFRPDVNQEVLDARKRLGETRGWTDENWHENPENLRTLFDELNSKDPALLDRLNQASDDSTQLATLSEVVTAATKVVVPEQKASETPTAPAAGAEPVPAAPAPPPVKKVSVFAKKPDRETSEQSQVAEQAVDPASSVPNAADTSSGQPAEPAPPPPEKKGLFARKPPTSDAGPPSEPAPAAESAESAAPPTLEELHAEIRSFAADPNNPLTEEEAKAMVADPDFEKKLAEAEKEIEAQLAELESDSGINA